MRGRKIVEKNAALLFVREEMSGMITVLLGHVLVVNYKHVTVNVGDVSVGAAEKAKGAIDDLIG